MPMLRTAQGLTADCAVCRREFQEGIFEGTSHELIHAMRAADWTTQPVVCAECAAKMHVWRNEGQPSDTSAKRRKAERAAALRTAANERQPRRRRSIDVAPAAANPSPRRRRRTLI